MTQQQTRSAPPPLPGPVVSEDVANLNLPAVRSKTGGVMAIIPTTWAEVAAMASAICRADMAPKSYQQKADKVAVAIMAGLEVGFTPMVALQSIAVINGQPSIYGDGLLALIMGSGLLEDFEETRVVDDRGIIQSATCKMWRKGRKTPSVQTITRAMVNQAGWFKKEGPWQATPDRMFQMRARGWCGRDAFPDVLRGLRSAEEVLDMLDVTEHGSATVAPAAPEPKRADYQAAVQTNNEPSPGTPPRDQAGGDGQAGGEAAPAGGDKAKGSPAQPDKPKKGTVTDVEDQSDNPHGFEKFTSRSKFYDFSDTFLQSSSTTPEMARAWEFFYRETISALANSDKEAIRSEINDTLGLLTKKLQESEQPREREPGEEG